MQIIESSVVGVRAARHQLKSPDSHLSITLFPMIHIGEPAYFDQVYADAFSHDVVLVEGVRSPVVQRLTRSYRWIDFSRLGLVVQPSYSPPESVSARMVHADLTQEEFEAEWKKVPGWQRALVFALTPAIGLKRRYLDSRQSIAEHLGMDDARSRREVLSWDPNFSALKNSILAARDARLVEHLREQIEQSDGSVQRLAVVYGAMHMRAVLEETRRQGYFSEKSEWMTVFGL